MYLASNVLPEVSYIYSNTFFQILVVNSLFPNFRHGFQRKHGYAHQIRPVVESMYLRQHESLASQGCSFLWHPLHNEIIVKWTRFCFPVYLIKVTQIFLSDLFQDHSSFRIIVDEEFSWVRIIEARSPKDVCLFPHILNLFVADNPRNSQVRNALYIFSREWTPP